MIHSLKLRHWKSHEISRLDFTKGTNLLIGPMGAGKTSVLDAICFALFGTFPALKSRKVSLEEVLMARPEQKREASVELAFELGGQRYSVTRTISPEGSEAYLRKGEQVIEGPQPLRTTEAVETALKLDYELFTRAIYAEQNKVDQFLTLAPRERKKQIDELLGLDAFETARATNVSAVNKLKTQRAEGEALLSSLGYAENKRLAANLTQELEALKTQAQTIATTLRSLEHDEQGAASRMRELESLEGRWREADRRVAALQAQATEAKAEIERERAAIPEPLSSPTQVKETQQAQEASLKTLESKLKNVRELALYAEKLKGKIEAIEHERAAKREFEGRLYEEEAAVLERLEGERSTMEANLANSRATLERVQVEHAQTAAKASELANKARERASLQNQILEIQKAHGEDPAGRLERGNEHNRELETHIAHANARAEDAQMAHQTLASGEAGCPVCDAPLTAERRNTLREQKLTRQKDALEKKAVLEAQLRKGREDSSELEKTVGKLRVAQERLAAMAEVDDALATARAAERELTNRLESLRTQCSELTERNRQITTQEERQREVVRALGELAELSAQEAKCRDELEALQGRMQGDSAEALEGEISRTREGLKGLERIATLYSHTERLASLEARLREATDEREGVNFDANVLVAARDGWNSLKNDIAQQRVRLEANNELRDEKEARLKEAVARTQEGLATEGRIAQLERQEMQLTVFNRALVDTQTILRSELIEGINETMALLWRSLYPYRDYTAVRLWGEGDDYDVELNTADGAWVAIEQASGGEKSSAALCLRISFAMVLAPQLSWLVLDEPTHNLDSNAVLLLAHALRDEIPKIVDQVFIITHDEGLKESASARVYRVERDKDRGGKSVVEEISLATAE